MKVVILGPYFYPQMSGIEKVMLAHARHLRQRGHTVHVVTSDLRFPNGRFDGVQAIEQRHGCTIHRLPVLWRRPPFPFAYPSNGGLVICGLSRKLRQLMPDVVHVHNIGAPAWAHAAARHVASWGGRLLYSTYFHPMDMRFAKPRKIWMNALNRLPLQVASRLLHMTYEEQVRFCDEYRFVPVERTAILPCGVEPPWSTSAVSCIRATRSDNPVVLFVGRVDDMRKGFNVLWTAMQTVWASRPDVVLQIVGQISDRCRASVCHPGVDVMGVLSDADLERCYINADVLAMPSSYEGFGMPFVEAMRYGVVAIGCKVGGVPFVVPPEVGILVPSGDTQAVAAGILGVLNNDQLRGELAMAGIKWAQQFYWTRIMDRLEAYL